MSHRINQCKYTNSVYDNPRYKGSLRNSRFELISLEQSIVHFPLLRPPDPGQYQIPAGHAIQIANAQHLGNNTSMHTGGFTPTQPQPTASQLHRTLELATIRIELAKMADVTKSLEAAQEKAVEVLEKLHSKTGKKEKEGTSTTEIELATMLCTITKDTSTGFGKLIGCVEHLTKLVADDQHGNQENRKRPADKLTLIVVTNTQGTSRAIHTNPFTTLLGTPR